MARRLNRQETIAVFRTDMARLLATIDTLSRDDRADLIDGEWTAKNVEVLRETRAAHADLVAAIEALTDEVAAPYTLE